MVWQEHDAAERLEEILDLTVNEGPQTVARNGKEIAVFVSFSEWKSLNAESQKYSETSDCKEKL
jgi:prevent-host-death family protein